MYDDVMQPHAAPLSWKDIEALPYILLGLIVLAGAGYALLEAGPTLQADTIKVAVISAMLGVRQVVLGRKVRAPR